MSKNFIDMVIGNLNFIDMVIGNLKSRIYKLFAQTIYHRKFSNLVSEEIRKYTRYDKRYNKFNESLYFLTNSEESLNFLAKKKNFFLTKKVTKLFLLI